MRSFAILFVLIAASWTWADGPTQSRQAKPDQLRAAPTQSKPDQLRAAPTQSKPDQMRSSPTQSRSSKERKRLFGRNRAAGGGRLIKLFCRRCGQ